MPSTVAGPAIAFNLGRKITAKGDGQDAREDCPDDTSKSTDFSLAFGAGLQIGRCLPQGRHDMGLESVADCDGVDISNSGFLFTPGYDFGAHGRPAATSKDEGR